MKLKNKIIISIFIFSLLLIGNTSFASTNISTTYHYAYGENVGFIDFANANVTNSALTGYAYGENIGWINLDGITNNKGTLTGYAYGENVGFIDFSKVSIDNGVFTGSAYGENIGWITFSPTDNNSKVVTTWKPASHSSSGSRVITPYTPPTVIIPTLITTTPTITTPNTIQRIIKLKSPRMTGDDIKEIQSYLNTKLNLKLIIDGIYGTQSHLAVISFQKLHNIKQDGVVGPITRGLMK